MSDVHVAPAPAPAAPAPAAPAETPIDTHPVHRPQPIGSQAPNKPVGDVQGSPHRTESRRETIQRAFAKAAERPGMGHNNPPEPMAKERTEQRQQRAEPKPKAKTEAPTETINLKKRPSDQVQRTEDGRFAARSQESAARQPQPGAPQQTRQAAQSLPDHAPYRQPPSQRGWSQAARNEWANTPESVRGDVHRMHKEFGQYYQRTRADQEVMNSIRHYHQMAQQHGTTLRQALDNYVGIEQMLRKDVIAGLNRVVENLNLQNPQTGERIGLRDIAYYLNNQTPEGHAMLQTRNQAHAQEQQMGQLYQAYNQLAKQQQQLIQGLRYNHTRGQVDQFAETHPRLDELGEEITRELGFGFDLPTAYRRAELLKPATHAAQTRSTSAQTRHVDRSISGAPTGGPPNGSGRPRKASANPREAVMNALKRVNGSI